VSEQPIERFARAKRFLRARLSPAGYLGLHLTLGLLIIAVAGWCFGDIAEDVSHHEAVVRTDETVAQWFHHHGTSLLTSAARAVSFVGSVEFITAASGVIAVAFLWKKRWSRLLVFAATMIGGSLLNICLKHLFHRQRPVLENPLVTLTSYGFPSGHTMGSTIFYGLLALFLVEVVKRWPARALIIFFSALIVLLVGLSRIYLGAHYLTDVLGAFAAGLAWLAFCWTGADTFRRRREWRESREYREERLA
jgi:membrane-associated phospholipid phosphatase